MRFERLLAEGGKRSPRGCRISHCPLGEALAFWRGPALVDFAYEPFAQAEIARLEELRLQAEEERVEAELALGRGTELVAELETLVARAPLRERRRGQHMLALYRSGRQADALSASGGETRFCRGPRIEPSPSSASSSGGSEQDGGLLAAESSSLATRESRRTVTVVADP
jgi:DNA-binding SARP family transcriptional activator